MKVTVCFGNDVRIVVPCGNGDLLVRELMNDAALRYKKNTNKFDLNVLIHYLMLADGGILDEGDHVCDVVDDKDQISASFEENEFIVARDLSNPNISIILNDSKSGEGGGKGDSPLNINSQSSQNNLQLSKKDGSNTDFNSNWMLDSNVNSPSNGVLTSKPNGIMTSSGTGVIPGQYFSPVLKKILNKKPKEDAKKSEDLMRFDEELNSDRRNSTPNLSRQLNESLNLFIRDSSRKSLSNQLVMSKWLDAQERMQDAYEDEIDNKILQSPIISYLSNLPSGTGSLPFRSKHRNGSVVTPQSSHQSLPIKKKRQAPDPPFLGGTRRNDSQVLPLHPHPPPRHHHLHPHLKLLSDDISAKEEESISLSNGLTSDSKINLIIPEIHFSLTSPDDSDNRHLSNNFDKQFSADKSVVTQSKLTPSKKGVLAPTNTRLIGNKIVIQMKKGRNGLGFSITTRDNVAGLECPIYIKNILPVGSAVEDGRLKAGDRLLEVNGVEMTGKSQTVAASVLRSIPVDAFVDLLVSRQVTDDDEDVEQKIFNSSISLNESVYDVTINDVMHETNDKKTLFIFNLAVNRSNLGFNVKNVCHDGHDLGIFVESTSKGGDLAVNDQLIEINGVTLYGLSNSEAVDILRSALQTDSGYLTVTVFRCKGNQFPFILNDLDVNACQLNEESLHIETETHLISDEKLSDVADHLILIHSDDSNFRDEEINNENDKEMTHQRNVAEIENRRRNSLNARLKNDAEVVETNWDERFDKFDSTGVFAREGFGRQSISEKRKGHVDPSSLIIYQKIKETKEKMISYDSATWDPRKSTLHQRVGEKREDCIETVSMKKSKSLEDLHVAAKNEEPVVEEEDVMSYPGNNESFRVAIDRSFDSPVPGKNINATEPKIMNSKESILTLSKASLFSNFWKSEKKKNDMDKIRNILKKGTDMLRFSKRRKSIEKKDFEKCDNDDDSSSLEANKREEHQKRCSKSNVIDSEPRFADMFRVNGGGGMETGDLEITHFGAECISRVVVKDRKKSNVEETSDEFQISNGRLDDVESKNVKLQQLRMEHRRQHKQRNGQYPINNIEDQYEQEQEQNETMHVPYPQPPPRRSINKSRQRLRPQPITTQPEISAQLEYPVDFSPSSVAQYSLDNRLHPYLRTALHNNYQPASSVNQSNIFQLHSSSSSNDIICREDRSSFVHSRQTSSPLPSLMPLPNHIRVNRRSSSEIIPIVTNHCLRTTYDPMSRLIEYGGVSQSSHV